MKTVTAALVLAIASTMTTGAFASYRLSPNASLDERPRYESSYAQIGAHRKSDVRGSRASLNPGEDPEARPHTHSTSPSHDVHVGGLYLGSDPDPSIRDSIRREGGFRRQP